LQTLAIPNSRIVLSKADLIIPSGPCPPYALGQGQEPRSIEAQSAYGLIDRPFQNLVDRDRSIHLANQTI
jgi:hypothetical protein